jgi:hypothetical protein
MPELIKTFNMKNTKPGGKVRVVWKIICLISEQFYEILSNKLLNYNLKSCWYMFKTFCINNV